MPILTDSMIYAIGGDGYGEENCGDYGSPLVANGILIGINSATHSCGAGYPDICSHPI